MDESKHQQLQKMFDATKKILDNKESSGLSEENIKELEHTLAAISGALLSSWLPRGIVRKLLLFFFLLIGIFGSLFYSYYFLISFVIAGMFSPRVVGEAAIFIGRMKGN